MMRRRRKCLLLTLLASSILLFLYSKMKLPDLTIPEVCQMDRRQFQQDIDVSLRCECAEFRFKPSSYVDSLINGFNSLGERHKTILYLTHVHGDRKVVLKYRKDSVRSLKIKDLNRLKGKEEKEEILKNLLSGNEFNGQPHFCTHPIQGNAFNSMSSDMERHGDNLLVANMNFEIILLKFLKSSGLPVPEYLANCGLYLMETFGGSTMNHFYKSPVERRLKIARNLLQDAESLTSGYRGFRIYLTDATKDNIAVDEETLAVKFIDLDDVIIQQVKLFHHLEGNKNAVHRHQKMECDNCFAYSTKDICMAPKSDINIFTICQLLLEDLKGDHRKGFLYFKDEQLQHYSREWRAKWDDLLKVLRECVYCDNGLCEDRFQVVAVLVNGLDELLNYNSQ